MIANIQGSQICEFLAYIRPLRERRGAEILGGNRAVRSGAPWTDAELRSAVAAYLYFLRLEQDGTRYSERNIARALQSSTLKRRNYASITYRLRNISSVVLERGWPALSTYSPAHKVGSRVRARIAAILDSFPTSALSFLNVPLDDNVVLPRNGQSDAQSLEMAISRLQALHDNLAHLERELAGIGHNRPPEPIEDVGLSGSDISTVRNNVRVLTDELLSPAPRKRVIERERNGLLAFGVKLATWVGERMTKATDVALAALTTVLIAKATDVLPLIADAVASIAGVLRHLAH